MRAERPVQRERMRRTALLAVRRDDGDLPHGRTDIGE